MVIQLDSQQEQQHPTVARLPLEWDVAQLVEYGLATEIERHEAVIDNVGQVASAY